MPTCVTALLAQGYTGLWLVSKAKALDIPTVKRVMMAEGRVWEEGEWGTLEHLNVT